MQENTIYELDLKQSYELTQKPNLSTLKGVLPSTIALRLFKGEIIDNNPTTTDVKTFLLKAKGRTIGHITITFSSFSSLPLYDVTILKKTRRKDKVLSSSSV